MFSLHRSAFLMILCSLVCACARPDTGAPIAAEVVSPPDHAALMDSVVERITKDVSVWWPKGTVVLDRGRYPSEYPELAELVKQKLTERNVPWLEVDLGSLDEWPGDWEEGETFRTNRTHALLSVWTSSRGADVSITWGVICGDLCATGLDVKYSWNGRKWIKTWEALVES